MFRLLHANFIKKHIVCSSSTNENQEIAKKAGIVDMLNESNPKWSATKQLIKIIEDYKISQGLKQ